MTCDLCQGRVARRAVGDQRMLVCRGCGFGQVVGGATGGADYWDRRGDLAGELAKPYWTTARTSVFAAALDRLAGGVQGRTLLDIGGGVGHFAACALEQGWDAYSLDVSPTATEIAGDRLGADRAVTELPPSLAGRCDAVTLWCVIAHVPDARPLLDQAVQALRPGGRLFLTTPNFRFQAGYARVLAAAGRPLDFAAHDHRLHFTAASLRLLLGRAGLRVEQFAYVGVTEDCLFDRRLAGALVPAKRVWNWTSVQLARGGLPLLSSELQVLATVTAGDAAPVTVG